MVAIKELAELNLLRCNYVKCSYSVIICAADCFLNMLQLSHRFILALLCAGKSYRITSNFLAPATELLVYWVELLMVII